MKLPEIRHEIKSTDTCLARLREHRDKLKKLRAEQLLRPQDDRRAQEVLRAIERGWLLSDGIPSEVAAIASGLNKGLSATESEIAEVEERRSLLVEQLPSEEEIAAATDEQAQTAGEVSVAIQNVATITENNASAAEEMSGSSEELSGQAAQLKELVGKFKI